MHPFFSERQTMLWLRFPPHLDVSRFIKGAGVALTSMGELKQEDAKTSVLVHLVYSTDHLPRAVTYDRSDSMLIPLRVSGLSVSEPYLLPRALVREMVTAISPLHEPGDMFTPDSESDSDPEPT